MNRRSLVGGALVGWIIASVLGCPHLEQQPSDRVAEELRPDQSEPLDPRHPAYGLRWKEVDSGWGYTAYRFRASTYSESEGRFKTIAGEYFRTAEVPEGERGPLIVVAPILGGAQNG